MVSLDTFLRCIRENAARIHGYELGHDGSDGESDCIGLIIGALGLAGFRWPGTHGTNWAARNAMRTLEYIEMPVDLFLGEIVYKAKKPGESGYDLPDKYKSSGDLLDYYHVGVVTSENPMEITHCTSRNGVGGVYRDNTMGNWRYGGELKYVDYKSAEEPDMETPYLAKVTADSGKTVNLRVKPDKKGTIIARIPVGEIVTVLDELDGWDQVSYRGKQGYMMVQFLQVEPAPAPEEPGEDTVTMSRGDLEAMADDLEDILQSIRDVLGHG